MGVNAGDYDAAPVASDVWTRMIARGQVKRENFRVLWESDPFPTSGFAVASELSQRWDLPKPKQKFNGVHPVELLLWLRQVPALGQLAGDGEAAGGEGIAFPQHAEVLALHLAARDHAGPDVRRHGRGIVVAGIDAHHAVSYTHLTLPTSELV